MKVAPPDGDKDLIIPPEAIVDFVSDRNDTQASLTLVEKSCYNNESQTDHYHIAMPLGTSFFCNFFYSFHADQG